MENILTLWKVCPISVSSPAQEASRIRASQISARLETLRAEAMLDGGRGAEFQRRRVQARQALLLIQELLNQEGVSGSARELEELRREYRIVRIRICGEGGMIFAPDLQCVPGSDPPPRSEVARSLDSLLREVGEIGRPSREAGPDHATLA